MAGLYFLFPTLLVIFISFLVVRAGSIALMMTGLDQKRAGFQALSAFSGTGFTTKEAESVVRHPSRRRIITWLMILGNVGLVTVIVTATSSLVTARGFYFPISLIVLAGGVYIIYKVATRTRLMRRWESFIEDRLVKSSAFEEGVTEDLLHLLEGYGLVRAVMHQDSPLVGSPLSACKLTEKEILVLGIERGRNWIPIPKDQERIEAGDRLVVYGPLRVLKALFEETKDK